MFTLMIQLKKFYKYQFPLKLEIMQKIKKGIIDLSLLVAALLRKLAVSSQTSPWTDCFHHHQRQPHALLSSHPLLFMCSNFCFLVRCGGILNRLGVTFEAAWSHPKSLNDYRRLKPPQMLPKA